VLRGTAAGPTRLSRWTGSCRQTCWNAKQIALSSPRQRSRRRRRGAVQRLRLFYIEVDDDTGYAAADVITRALTYLDQRTPVAELDAGPEPEPRDLLADLVEVLGEQRVRAADVPARLRDLAPGHVLYRGLTGVKLREIIEREYGIKVASTGNRYPVDPNKIRTCIAWRVADDHDDRSG
jgi:hypothetical protein